MRYLVDLPARVERRYWLVDTANLPEGEVLRRFYETTDQPVFRWLYEGTPYHEVRESGPVLLDMTEDDGCWQQYRYEWVGHVASVLIDTAEPLDELQQRLAASLTIDTPEQGVGLLRFHEPAALHLLLGEGLLDSADRLALAGEGNCWSWPLCQMQGRIVHERYASTYTTDIAATKKLRLDVSTQQRLQGLGHFSRLMPLLGDVIHRFGLLQTEDAITSLWRELERYWHDTWQVGMTRKQALEVAQGMFERSDALEQFVEELGAYAQGAFPLDAMTR